MRAMLESNRKLTAVVVVCALMLLASVGLVAVAIDGAVNSQDRTNRQICAAFNRFDAVLTASLQRSLVTLPTLAYFREHPSELAAQVRTIRRQIVLFRQRPC